MTTILVWYFLVGGAGSNIATAGPFATEQQCKELADWSFRWKYVSKCYEAPLATPQAQAETCHAKTGCH